MQNVNFSNAYYKSGLSVLVKKDSKITGFDDLKGHVVATKKATSSVDYMMDHGIDAKYITQFQNIDVAYQALVTGGADAVSSAESRVGKECVSTCRSRWARDH